MCCSLESCESSAECSEMLEIVGEGSELDVKMGEFCCFFCFCSKYFLYAGVRL